MRIRLIDSILTTGGAWGGGRIVAAGTPLEMDDAQALKLIAQGVAVEDPAPVVETPAPPVTAPVPTRLPNPIHGGRKK